MQAPFRELLSWIFFVRLMPLFRHFEKNTKQMKNLTQTQTQQPYAPAQPALNQIISEAGKIYQQGPAAAGYVAPTTQTTQGLAGMETMANAAQQQLADTLSGKYLNPFLTPLMQKTAGDIYSNVATQFSGAGRTPGSPLMQNQVTQQVAQAALPLAFQQLETHSILLLPWLNFSNKSEVNCSPNSLLA